MQNVHLLKKRELKMTPSSNLQIIFSIRVNFGILSEVPQEVFFKHIYFKPLCFSYKN